MTISTPSARETLLGEENGPLATTVPNRTDPTENENLKAAKKLARMLTHRPDTDDRIVLFLGAGCSRSSGIPLAGELAATWVEKCSDEEDYTKWRANPGQYYGAIFDRAFDEYHERHKAVSEIIRHARPAFGYYVLAKLIERDILKNRKTFQTILTTNFDDLLEQALTIHTSIRPQIISLPPRFEEGKASGQISLDLKTRINGWLSVVKLHGDYRSATLNGQQETEKLTHLFRAAIAQAVHNHTLVFIGYGGNDAGIADLFTQLREEDKITPSKVYWLGDGSDNDVMKAFDTDKVQKIRLNDFDKFMHMMLAHGELPHLSLHRLSEFSEDYVSYLTTVAGEPLSPALDDWSQYVIGALSMTNIDDGLKKMREGINLYPSCAPMLSSYAHYCKDKFADYDKAEEFYRRALKVDPNHWRTHVHMATYWRDKKNPDLAKAAELCRKAIEIYDKDINAHVIYFGILIALSNHDDAKKLAKDLSGIPKTKEIMLEFQYYSLFIDYSEEVFKSVSEQVNKGDRTPNCEYEFILNSQTGRKHTRRLALQSLAKEMTS